ncbi:hypothetical protein KS4_26230 [Poriferisphaera corsica]|uniref:Ice-binding protein C-terminal domain-containing protein n=1 Tax=Poriferisphaera corsica TaxID=2528020 RepID=A0A517YWF1_9BACT|nr:PEP-CTERM sorting domain-containing protein [Poriferisphaera corsica]QDU34553.1 hypothetical protein KS4_26230 [Poriferisphaera corsica]
MHAFKALICTATMIATTATLGAAEITLQNGLDGYNGMTDSWLTGGNATWENTTYGTSGGAYGNILGGAGGAARRVVQQWDLSSLKGKVAKINSARIYTMATGGNQTNINIYKIASTNASWTDAQTGTDYTGWDRTEVCWRARKAGDGDSHWLNEAGEVQYGIISDSSKLIGQNTAIAGTIASNVNIFFDIDVDTIKEWIDSPELNAGMVYNTDNEFTSGKFFVIGSQIFGSPGTPPVEDDGYGNTIAYYPRLVIDYTEVPEPASLALIGLGGLAFLSRRK